MAKKPTYKELEQRIGVLEENAATRKRAEEALRESNERYRTVIEHSNDGVAIAKGDNHLYVNKKFVEIFGYDRPEEIVGKRISVVIHPRDRERVTEFNRLRQQGNPAPSRYECEGLRKNGEAIYLEVSATKSIYRGEPVSLVFLRDVTQRRQAEDALRESEAQKSAILDASVDRIRYVDKDMKIIWGNKATALVHGLSPEDLVGRTCYETFVGRDTPCKGCATVKARETGKIESAEIYQPEVKGIKGGTYWNAYCVPLKNNEGDIEGFIQIGRDITVRKLAEERIHTLSQELLKAQENERQRISRYLHDHVAQDLSILKIGCETLFDDYPDAHLEKKKRVSELSEIIQGTITSVRGLAYDLRPPGLDQLGLIQSVFQYCEDFSENTGLVIDFKAAGMDGLKVEPDIEINLYRLVQEGLNNIKQHAEANRVIVKLVASFPNIILRIEDDGKGFDVEGRLLRASKEKRMGLGSMEERVSLLNGSIRIQSRLMEGTKIVIEIPFKEKKSG